MALARITRLAVVVTVVAGIALSACSDDDSTVSSSSTTVVTTVPGGSSTTAATAPTTTASAGKVAAFSFSGGNVTGDSEVTAKVGEQVTIVVVSDVAEEVHVHTYDLMVELEPNVAGQITFTADIPGVHEVELEDSGLHLTSLKVQ